MRRRSSARLSGLSLTVLLVSTAPAQAQEGKLAADFRRESGHVAEKCASVAPKAIAGCAVVLITDHPLHLSLGSIAPENGFAFGLAFVPPQWNPNDDWRIRWSADVVATPYGAWRAGAYFKFINTRVGDIVVARPGEGTTSDDALPRPYPTLTAHAQVTSLPAVSYFGLGNESALEGRSAFAMRQTSVGARVFWPIGRSGPLNRLNTVAIGEVSGRWVHIGSPTHGADPSIADLYTDETAPGLEAQPATIQFSEGVRIAPALGRVQLTYTARLDQFIAPSDNTSSFRRWSLDLRHEFGLWSTSRLALTREANTPNECATADRTVTAYGCPDPTIVTTNRNGTIGLRAFVSRADVSGDSRVPFYFQRTIGGADIDGERLLASFEDYRFRAPNLMVLQATIEHVIWGPIGAFGSVEQGRVALTGESLTNGAVRRTFGAGLTLRAGGVPMATLWWANGGTEGSRVAFLMNTSLFGGSARPSLQ